MTTKLALASTALAAAFATAVVSAQNPAPANTPSSTSGNAVTGKRLYTDYYCYACHGTEGQGGRDGARLAPNPPPFNSLLTYLRKPSGTMPGYSSKVVTDQELADIYAFLKTIPPPPSLKNIPLLAP